MKIYSLLVAACLLTAANVSQASVTTNMAAWLSPDLSAPPRMDEMQIPRFDGVSKAYTTTQTVFDRDNAGGTNSRLSRAIYCPDEKFIWIGPEMDGYYLIAGTNIVFCTKKNRLQFKLYGWSVNETNAPQVVLARGFETYVKRYFEQQRFYSVGLSRILGEAALWDAGMKYTPDGTRAIGWSGPSNREPYLEVTSVGFDSTNIVVSIVGENGVKSSVTFRPDFKPIAAVTNGVVITEMPTNCVRVFPQKTIRPEWVH